MQLSGFHHLTAVTADAARNHHFYTQTLGLRLVKKTVNQDDVAAYHLFYADGLATPGTDLTFFDWPAPLARRGTQSVARTGLRVGSAASLGWWTKRFQELGVTHGTVESRAGRDTLDFEDFEGQRLSLVVDPSGSAHPWAKSPVPAEHQIRGLGPITMSVPELAPTDAVLTKVMSMRLISEYRMAETTGLSSSAADRKRGENHGVNAPDTNGGHPATVVVHVYQMGGEGAHAELHVAVEPGLSSSRPGAGGVHHVAFRTPNVKEYMQWAERLGKMGMSSSGPVDRYYFRSLYFREPNGILFEIATDGPGFAADESMETLGQKLALPPFLEDRRAAIEAGLKPLQT